MAAHQFNCGDHEQLERYHRGNRIPRQAKGGLLVAPAEDGRLARANRNRVEEEFRAELAKNLFNQIIFTDGHSTRKDQNIRFDASPNESAKLYQFIRRTAQHYGLASCHCNLRGKGDAVAVANLK